MTCETGEAVKGGGVRRVENLLVLVVGCGILSRQRVFLLDTTQRKDSGNELSRPVVRCGKAVSRERYGNLFQRMSSSASQPRC